ncbi:MAG: zf-HC2 domain-containing protein, partial [Candidatus Acidiferrales bacterium]
MERNAQHAFDAEEVMAYLDGELEARRAAALAAHLVSCSECQEVAQGFRALSERMLSFEVEHPSAGMNEAILVALNSGKPSSEVGKSQPRNQLDWDWHRVFARPRNWAIACTVFVVAILAIAIPHARREPAFPVNGRNSTNLVTVERETANSQASDLYAHKFTQADDMHMALAPAPPPPPPGEELKAPEAVGPMIVQTASLTILATNYEEASAAIEKLAAAH